MIACNLVSARKCIVVDASYFGHKTSCLNSKSSPLMCEQDDPICTQFGTADLSPHTTPLEGYSSSHRYSITQEAATSPGMLCLEKTSVPRKVNYTKIISAHYSRSNTAEDIRLLVISYTLHRSRETRESKSFIMNPIQ